jgi:hypothetical protein
VVNLYYKKVIEHKHIGKYLEATYGEDKDNFALAHPISDQSLVVVAL